jgi:hypothetical protein
MIANFSTYDQFIKVHKLCEDKALAYQQVLWQKVHKLIDNISTFSLVSAQDENNSIAGKYEIISTRIVDFV